MVIRKVHRWWMRKRSRSDVMLVIIHGGEGVSGVLSMD